MVAGHEADPAGLAERLHPACGGHELLLGGDVHDVTRQRHVVRRVAHDVRRDGKRHRGAVQAVAVETPVHHAQGALEGEVPARRAHGQRAKMKIGQMSEREQEIVFLLTDRLTAQRTAASRG